MNELAVVKYLAVSPDLVVFPYLISLLGSVSFLATLVVFLFLIGEEYKAAILSIGSFFTGALVYFLKFLIRRPRPVIEETIQNLAGVGGFSFPSGHSTLSFLFATIFSSFYEKGKYLYILSAVVAVSRILLGVHYPTDLIVGGLLGYGIGKLVVRYGKDSRLSDFLK